MVIVQISMTAIFLLVVYSILVKPHLSWYTIRGSPASGTRPTAVATTWGGVRNIENRCFNCTARSGLPKELPKSVFGFQSID